MRIEYCLGNIIGDEYNYLKMEFDQIRITHELSEATVFTRISDGFRVFIEHRVRMPMAWLPVCVNEE